eukprot:gene6731-10896_t
MTKTTEEKLKNKLIAFGIGATISAAITTFSAIYYSRALKKSNAIRNTDKVKIETLLEKSDEYNGKYVKVIGVTTSETPLIAPMSNEECIMHKSQTWRVFETMTSSKQSTKQTNSEESKTGFFGSKAKVQNSSEQEQKSWKEGKEIITEDKRSTDLYIRPRQSGACILIQDPFTSIYFSLPNTLHTKFFPQNEYYESKKVKGIQEIEEGLKLGQPLFILGEFVSDEDGTFIHPVKTKGMNDTKTEKLHPYIVTAKSEDVILSEIESNGRFF